MKKFVSIQLDKIRNLRFGMQAIMRVEQKLNKPFSAIDFEKEMKFTEIVDVIWAGLVHEDPSLTPDKVAELIDDHSDIQTVMEKMGEAMAEAFGSKNAQAMQKEVVSR